MAFGIQLLSSTTLQIRQSPPLREPVDLSINAYESDIISDRFNIRIGGSPTLLAALRLEKYNKIPKKKSIKRYKLTLVDSFNTTNIFDICHLTRSEINSLQDFGLIPRRILEEFNCNNGAVSNRIIIENNTMATYKITVNFLDKSGQSIKNSGISFFLSPLKNRKLKPPPEAYGIEILITSKRGLSRATRANFTDLRSTTFSIKDAILGEGGFTF